MLNLRLRPSPKTLVLAAGGLLLLALALATLLSQGGGPGPSLPAAPDQHPPAPTPTPTPLAPPSVQLAPALAGDQGIYFWATARIESPVPGRLSASVSYGDGTREELFVPADGTVTFGHAYRAAGSFDLELVATGPTGTTTASTRVEVVPRVVVFVQGMNSESRCPGGEHFLDRAPAWLDAPLDGLAIGDEQRAYFSYSGHYCDGSAGASGAAPDYRKSDTCDGIASTAAQRLRALIDALAPSRVTVVAHSMGGLVTAYLIGSDPAWAREHIVSVATFDSPLHGIDRLRSEVLGFYRLAESGCGRDTPAMHDLRSGSEVTAVAAGAGHVVPFFTLDGDRDESGALGLAEAVPGDSTSIDGEWAHLRVNEEHSALWSRPPKIGAADDKGQFVACAVLADPRQCTAPVAGAG